MERASTRKISLLLTLWVPLFATYLGCNEVESQPAAPEAAQSKLKASVANRAGSAAAAGQPWILGDANNDGTVTVVDALLLAQHSVGAATAVDVHLINSDVDGDHQISIVDAMLVSQREVGLISSFLIETTPYVFQDSTVASAARTALGKGAQDPVTQAELRRIDSLDIYCDANATVDLADVREMMGLSRLTVANCTLSGWTALADLARFQQPIVAGDPDPSMVGRFAAMNELVLFNVGLTDASVLPLFGSLETLDLAWNSIASVTSLGNLKSLKTLKLRANSISDPSPLAALTSLETLDLSWNNNIKVDSLGVLQSLRLLDVRGTGVRDSSPLSALTNLQVRLTGEQVVTCRPGGVRGDFDGDGAVTREDVNIATSLLIPHNPVLWGGPIPSDDIRCIDLDGNNRIDSADIALIRQTAQGLLPLDRIGVACSPYSIVGDVDGDGVVTTSDADVIAQVVNGTIASSQNTCCLDVNRDGMVTSADATMALAIANKTSPSAGVCDTVKQGIGVVTYDLRVSSLGGTPEPYSVPEDVIDSLQASVMQNSLLLETDIILLPEFSYSMRDKPVQLKDNGATATPRYEIVNDNTVVTKVKRLQQLAAVYRLVIALPLAEKVVYTDENNDPLPVLWNSTLVIEKDGSIQHVRRKTFDMQGRVSKKVYDQCFADFSNSFELLSFVSRSGKTFTGVIVVCAENDDSGLIEKMQRGSGQGPWHADLLLYPQGGFTQLQGDESMKRLQYFDHARWPAALEIPQLLSLFVSYVDHVVYAGLALPPKHSQGIYRIDGKPLPYMFSDNMDQGGYLYARVNVGAP